MLFCTLWISCGPKPVAVLLCLGLEIPGGPTGDWNSVMGADVLGFLSLVPVELVVELVAMMFSTKSGFNDCVIKQRKAVNQKKSDCRKVIGSGVEEIGPRSSRDRSSALRLLSRTADACSSAQHVQAQL